MKLAESFLFNSMCVWLWLDSPTHQNRMLLGINLPIPASSIIYLPLQKIQPHPLQCLCFSRLRCCLREVVLCVCVCVCNVVVRGFWGGGIRVVAVQTLSLPLRGVSVVALSSRHYGLVSLLACGARQPFLSSRWKHRLQLGGVMQAVGMRKKKSICWELKVWKSGQSLYPPFNLRVSQLFIHEYTVFSSNITNSMTGKRQQEANIFWFYLEQ